MDEGGEGDEEWEPAVQMIPTSSAGLTSNCCDPSELRNVLTVKSVSWACPGVSETTEGVKKHK